MTDRCDFMMTAMAARTRKGADELGCGASVRSSHRRQWSRARCLNPVGFSFGFEESGEGVDQAFQVDAFRTWPLQPAAKAWWPTASRSVR